MCCWTASQGRRRSAPISGGPNGCSCFPELVKELDMLVGIQYRQDTLPPRQEALTMTTSTHEEIRVGSMAIRFLVEGEESAGSVAVFEFDVPAGSKAFGYGPDTVASGCCARMSVSSRFAGDRGKYSNVMKRVTELTPRNSGWWISTG